MANFTDSETSNVSVQSSSADVVSTSSAANSVATSSVNVAGDAALKTLEQRTEIEDIDNKHRDLTITEKDGTKIKVQIVSPSLRDSEIIDSKRSVVVEEDGETSARLTPAKFHEAMFKMFNNNSLLINEKPTDESINWGFFENHDKETYHWFMDQAETFLTD